MKEMAIINSRREDLSFSWENFLSAQIYLFQAFCVKLET
jgi:hypothetical protein